MPTALKVPDVTPLSVLFKALGDETRVRIIALLAQEELCVCHIEAALKLTQPNASRHLAILRSARIVDTRREGNWIYYRIADQDDPGRRAQLRTLVNGFSKLDLLKQDVARLLETKGPLNCLNPIAALPQSCRIVASAAVVALTIACGKGPSPRPTVVVDGSSTVFPISEAVAAQFQRGQPVRVDVKVPVGVSGTRGGFRKFCAGKTDLTGASRPITTEEAALCAKENVEYVELPIAYDALAVVVNAKNSWARTITTEELKEIWEPAAEGKIARWSQVREGWPDKELRLYGAGLDSGTYDYFTQAIVGREHSSRRDFVASEDDNVLLKKLEQDEHALGFFGYAYFKKSEGRLRALHIDDGDPSNGPGPIEPSAEAVRSGTYQPLSRPLLIYVSKAALQRREVVLFVDYYLTKAAKHAERAGYVALPDRAYTWAKKRAAARTTGSILAGQGSLVGMSIDQLLRKEEPAN